MNRTDFQRLALARLRDANVLLKERRFSAAYYLCGYAIECALKACIAKQTKRHSFPPDRRTVERLYTHDIAKLATEAGLDSLIRTQGQTDPDFDLNWAIVKGWSEQTRYAVSSSKDATELVNAVSDPAHGILTWLQQHW